MSTARRLEVHRNRVGEWLDRLRGLHSQVDGVVREDDGQSFCVQVALPGFAPGEIEVEIAPDHLVIDASALRAAPIDGIGALQRQADVHLLLPFPEAVDCAHAAARLRSGVLTIRAPRLVGGEAR
jgi:HSP20 family molecular chaperone IbpA